MAGNANNIIVGAATVSIDASDVGYTKGGVTVSYEPTWIEVTADQAVGIVRRARSNERLYVKTSLLEITLTQIRRAFMYPSGNLVGSTLTLGYNSSCYVDTHALVLVGAGPNCGVRTFTFPSCVAFGNREIKMVREEEQSFEIQFEVLKDSDGHFGTVVDS